jgi:hypothetical protein
MAFKADYQGGKTTEQLLDQYGAKGHLDERFRFQTARVLVARRTGRPEPEGMEAGLSDANSLIHMREASQGCRPLRHSMR